MNEQVAAARAAQLLTPAGRDLQDLPVLSSGLDLDRLGPVEEVSSSIVVPSAGAVIASSTVRVRVVAVAVVDRVRAHDQLD